MTKKLSSHLAEKELAGPSKPFFNVRPKPMKGEAWVGFLLRFSHANGLPSASSLIGHLDQARSPRFPQEPPSVLRALAVDASELVETARPQEHQKSWKTSSRNNVSLGHTKYFRVCPDCLKDDEVPHVRAMWTHPIALTCKTHKTLLLDACKACRKDLDWLQPSVQKCSCGHDLMNDASIPAPPWATHLEALFKEAAPEGMDHTFAQSTSQDRLAAKVIAWLLKPVNKVTGLRPRASRDSSALLSMKLAAQTMDWISGWTDAQLNELIDQFRLETDVDLKRAKSCLGARRFSSMRNLVDQAVKRRAALDTERLLGPISDEPVQTCPVMRWEHLALVTSMSRLRVVAAVKAGLFSGVKLVALGARKKQDVRPSHEAFVAIKAAFEDSMSCQKVCRYLNLSWRNVQQLAADGRLSMVEKTRTGGVQRFLKSDVYALARQAPSSLQKRADPNKGTEPSKLDLCIRTLECESPPSPNKPLASRKNESKQARNQSGAMGSSSS